MEERELVSIIESEIAASVGHWDGSLAAERKTELDYYNSQPFGNEVEGESQVVSSDVSDTVEGILPHVLRIFTSSDDAVRFDPNGPEDEAQAAQKTEVCNYVFYRQNNGFLILYEWFKDALIQKNGVVKYWWEDKQETTTETYQGLTEGEYRTLLQDEGVEELGHTARPDPDAQERIDALKASLPQRAQGNPQMLAALEAELAQAVIPEVHDATVRVTKDLSRICIEAIPPEEFGISAKHNCVSIQEAPFCYHRTRKTISSLRAAGCPEAVLAELSTAEETDLSPEAQARDRFLEVRNRDNSAFGQDDSGKEVWVTECFIRLDADGDGVAELRHVIMPGRSIWVNEAAAHINFAALTPIIMPHRWVGRSAAEMVMDIQFTKSVIWRQMLNNLYLTNNPGKTVLASAGGIVQANLDDLLVSRPGAIRREYVPNAIRNDEVPFVAAASFPMLEYMDGIKENRLGLTRYNQGTDADSLNKTARGIALIQSAGQQRLDLIARIFAETGVKDLFRGIAYMLSRYSSKAMTLKLRNKWVDVDPRDWKTQFNMTVNVGLGTGNRDVLLAHLERLGQDQLELLQSGRGYMVSDENVYNLRRKRAETMGFKHPELFITDPQSVPEEKKKTPPPPEIVKAQVEAQIDQAKLQFNQWKEQLSAQTLQAVEQIKSQTQIVIADKDNETKKEIERMRLASEGQLTVFKSNREAQDEMRDLDHRRKEIGYEDQILALKKNFDSVVGKGQEMVIQQNDERLAGHTSTLMGSVEAMDERMLAQMNGIGQLLSQMAQMLTLQAETQRAAIMAEKRPKTVSIDKVKLDENGRIQGAQITSTSTVQ